MASANKSYKDQVVWIIGASSGIGRALAVELHTRGAKLVLSARRQDELEKLNAELGGQHFCQSLDIGDQASLQAAVGEIHTQFGRIDRTVLLASIYQPMKINALDLKKVSQIVDVNLKGAFNTLSVLSSVLDAQANRGDMAQLAVTASVAGYIGLPNSQPYAATKAATISLVESYRAEAKKGVDVRLICPGFVETPMTGVNEFPMPMIIRPEAAAKEIADGLAGKKFEIHFPKKFTFMLKLISALPYWLALPIISRLRG
ncbi:MAG: SDR family NAD(P)-dependent oxidoreductase [Alphaproteobacteria bacterium]